MDERTVAEEVVVAEQVDEGNAHLSVESAVNENGGGVSKKSRRKPAKSRKRSLEDGARSGSAREDRPRRGGRVRVGKSKLVRLKEGLYNWYKSAGCLFCGESHPGCVELHHPQPVGSKHIRAAQMLQSPKFTLADLRAELKLTLPMCSNCHRKLHWRSVRYRWERNGKRVPYADWKRLRIPMEPQFSIYKIEDWSGWADAMLLENQVDKNTAER